MAKIGTQIKQKQIEKFCKQWNVREFALFGSVLRSDFNETSDVDVMISFQEDVGWSLLDHVSMRDELVELFGRNVDLVTRKGIERSKNTIRRASILETAKVFYAET
jgi:predicted nucleotidyltransferase